MYRFRFFVLSSLIIFLVGTTAFAATETPTKQTAANTVTPVLVGTVNIQDAKIISQKDNTLELSFSISNRTGIQSGVKYGVELVSEVSGKQFAADQKIYDETLSLAENSVTKKDIFYTAPNSLHGTYAVLITSSNTNGFPFGITVAGKATFASGKSLEIAVDSCTTSASGSTTTHGLFKPTVITPAQTLTLNCSATNTTSTTLSAVPYFQTTLGTAYGAVVYADGGSANTITFGPGETKHISIVLPQPLKPQIYTTMAALKAGDMVSNSIAVPYIIQGAAATIMNVSFDKDYYNRNDTANLVMVWSSSNDGAKLHATLTNDRGTSCASPIDRAISLKSDTAAVALPVAITGYCYNPMIDLTLTDANGNVLDHKTFSITTTSAKRTIPLPSTRTLLIIAAILLIIIMTAWYMKKRDHKTLPSSTLSIFVFFLLAGMTFFAHANVAHANQYSVGGVTFDVNIDSGSYTTGQSIYATGSAYSGNSAVDTAYLAASTPGSSGQLIYSGISVGQTIYGSINLIAPSAQGSYNVTFTGGVNIPPPPAYTNSVVNAGVYDDYTSNGTPAYMAEVCLANPSQDAVQYYFDWTYDNSDGSQPGSMGAEVDINPGDTCAQSYPQEIWPDYYGVSHWITQWGVCPQTSNSNYTTPGYPSC